jgi:hypothetical protein
MKNKLKGCFENLEGRCGNQGREIRKKERKKKVIGASELCSPHMMSKEWRSRQNNLYAAIEATI